MPEVPGCSTTSGWILHYVSQHAFLAILTHTHATHGTLSRSDINKAETDDRRLTEQQTLQ